MALIQVTDLTKEYRLSGVVTPVLREVGFTVAEGEFVSIIGPSGSGKTTLLNLLGGLDRDYRGSLRIADAEMRDLSDREISTLRNRTIGFIFQSFHLLEHLTCLENVKLPLFFSGQKRESNDAEALAALEKVGVADKAGVRPTYISGGQKQRVAIARALMMSPRLLLCDEPTGNLDRETGAQIVDLFHRLNREMGMTLLVVTHDERVSRTARRILRLHDRRIDDTAGPGAGAEEFLAGGSDPPSAGGGAR